MQRKANRQNAKPILEEEEIEQATELISKDMSQDEVEVITEIQDGLIYESIVDAPTSVEVVEIPYSTVDGMFFCWVILL